MGRLSTLNMNKTLCSSEESEMLGNCPVGQSNEETMKKLLIACAVFCVAVSAADSRPRKAHRQCKGPIKVSGAATIRTSKAENSAIEAWRQRVIDLHGQGFADLERARRVRKRCRTERVSGSMRSLRMRRCTVSARPCSSGS